MAVQMLNIPRQHAALATALEDELLAVFRSGMYIGGDKIAAFERNVAAYCGCRFAVGVSSGTDALLAALMALDIGAGDEVITTVYSFFATAGVIARLGATPVFCDIDADTFNINPAEIAAKITPKTRAILPVHLYGQCAAMTEIMRVAGAIPVVEDCAQAIGAEVAGKRAGSFGVAGCFSFFPSKNLGGIGDGGMLTTNDEALAHRLRLLRNHGMEPKYHHHFVGGNFRLDAVQAAVLNIKLTALDQWTAARQSNAAWYRAEFARRGLDKFVKLPVAKAGRHIYNQFTLRCERRDELVQFLQGRGIGCDMYYPVPFSRQECFRYLNCRAEDYPVAEAVSRECVSIPIYDQLTAAERGEVVAAFAEFYSN
ncbi:pleiotropic regulatory protein [Planctomycetales bacterium]|nr:pleiotropic regulatory protein [Planctomycetales bacterium]